MSICERSYDVAACDMKEQGWIIQEIYFNILWNIYKEVLCIVLTRDYTQLLFSAQSQWNMLMK